MRRVVLALCWGLIAICGTSGALASVAESAAVVDVPYLTGGVGDEEWQELQSRASDYNLRLLFAEKSTGGYLAEVTVLIRRSARETVLVAEGCGPRFLARLPAGRYELTIEYQGWQQVRTLGVSAQHPAEAVFYFP